MIEYRCTNGFCGARQLREPSAKKCNRCGWGDLKRVKGKDADKETD